MRSGKMHIGVHEYDLIIHTGEQIDLYPTLHPCGKAPDPPKLCAENYLRHSVCSQSQYTCSTNYDAASAVSSRGAGTPETSVRGFHLYSRLDSPTRIPKIE